MCHCHCQSMGTQAHGLTCPLQVSRSKSRRRENETRRRSQDEETRDYDPPARLPQTNRSGEKFSFDDQTTALECTLIQEGAFRRACTVLTQDPLVDPAPDIVSELRKLHPAPLRLVSRSAQRSLAPSQKSALIPFAKPCPVSHQSPAPEHSSSLTLVGSP